MAKCIVKGLVNFGTEMSLPSDLSAVLCNIPNFVAGQEKRKQFIKDILKGIIPSMHMYGEVGELAQVVERSLSM